MAELNKALLRKCPFCGGEGKILKFPRCERQYVVICENNLCNASIGQYSTSKENAIWAWNNRVTETEIRANAIDEFAEKLKAELSEQIFSDEEKFKYERKEQEAICAQNATWKMAIRLVNYVAEQLKERD